MIGTTVEDLLRWEHWLDRNLQVEKIHVVGISCGGDLALLDPAFSSRVERIFASGTLGYCIPGILEWTDRSDIAGLSAPRVPLRCNTVSWTFRVPTTPLLFTTRRWHPRWRN